ncbi:MAG: class I SAM-dependent methyltransferase [Chloroflexi bacterium]|nr:class I SAM-dependent methyltransferase [Chloroflexota bacterium]
MIPVGTPYLRRQVDQLVTYGGIRAGERVLDVGCGMGRYTLILAERGIRVEGLDLSQVLLDRLVQFNNGRFNIPLHCGDILNPPPELLGQFDAVVGFFTLHHLHDVAGCLQGMRRLLKNNGRLVFLEPNPLNPLYYLQILFIPGMTWQGEKGIRLMSPRYIFDALNRANFAHSSFVRFGFFPPFIANFRIGARLERLLERVPIWRAGLPFQIFRGECGDK